MRKINWMMFKTLVACGLLAIGYLVVLVALWGIEAVPAVAAETTVRSGYQVSSGLEIHSDGTIRIAAAAGGDGIQGGAGSALAVDTSDFAGTGLEDDGSENLRVKLDGATLTSAAGGVKITDNGVAVGQLAAAIQDLLPNILLQGTNDEDGTGSMAIQVRDAADNSLAQRFLLRVWIADAEFSEPDAQTDLSVTTGEQMREIEADADYEVITDATGAAAMNIDTVGDKTVYVMAEADGRIYTGSVAITGN